MLSGARASSSNMPQSDTDVPLVPDSGDKQMMRGGQLGEYGDVSSADTERLNTGVMKHAWHTSRLESVHDQLTVHSRLQDLQHSCKC